MAGVTTRLRMGQVPDAVYDQAALALVRAAEPRLRSVIAEERALGAEAAMKAIPWAAAAAAALVATSQFVPEGSTALKALGYGGAAAALAVGAGAALSEAAGRPPEAPAGAVPGLVEGIASSAARSLVREAEPAVRAIVDDERRRLSEAATGAAPYAGLAAAAFLATAYFVPDRRPAAKALGYGASAGLLLLAAVSFIESEGA